MKKLLLSLLAIFAISLQIANAKTRYGIYIDDVEITSDNALNVRPSGASGAASYNANTHVLTLINYSANTLRFSENTTDVTVKFSKNCQFSGKVRNISKHKVTFRGEGDNDNFSVGSMEALLTNSDIELAEGSFSMNLNRSQKYGLFGSTRENLIITNATVWVGGSTCAIDSWNNITFNDCEVLSPEGAVFENNCLCFDGDEIHNQIVRIGRTHYGIFLTGGQVEITSANATNVTHRSFGGKVSYDAKTHTLTLDDFIGQDISFKNNNCDIKVKFSGNCLLNSEIFNESGYKVTFCGQNATDQLTCTCIRAKNFMGDDIVDASGRENMTFSSIELANGIYRINEDMVSGGGLYSRDNGVNLTINGAEVYTNYLGSWSSITFNGCEIVSPKGATVELDPIFGDYNVCLNGEVIQNQMIHIMPTTTAIENIKADSETTPQKFMRDGNIYIRRNGHIYSIAGSLVE